MVRGTGMLVCVAASLILAACGDDSQPGASSPSSTTSPSAIADRQLRENVVEALDSRNAQATCALYSDRLLKLIYRTARKCETRTKEDQEAQEFVELNEAVTPLDASIDDDHARVQVKIALNGHGFDGHVGMRKIEERWLLDEIETDLIRASYTEGAELKALNETIPGIYSAAGQRCYSKPYEAMSDQEVVSFFYALARQQEPEYTQNSKRLTDCIARTKAGISFPRAAFEFAARKALAQEGLDLSIVNCGIDQLRKDVPDKVFDDGFETESDDLPPSVDRALTKALQSCSRATA